MFSSVLSVAAVALAAASSVQAIATPHSGKMHRRAHHDIAARADDADKPAPSTYAEGYLEAYSTYHVRYLALDCDQKHNTQFFDDCCHPLLATENLKDDRKPECTPSDKAMSSASAALPTSTVQPDADCEDDETPAATGSPAPAKSSASSAEPVKNVAAAAPTSAKPSSSSSQAAPKPTATQSSGGNNSGSSGGAGDITGHATFYYQKGNAGACGAVHGDEDLLAALPTNIFKPLGNGASALCGKKVQVTNTDNGKSVTVTAVDQCPTCTNLNTDIDLSKGAFDQIGAESTGLLNVKWKIL